MAKFTFRLAKLSKPRVKHEVSQVLYCLAKNEDDKWKAYVNTRGLEGYSETTILPFSEKTFNLKSRCDVFRTNKDEKNHWVRVIRNLYDAELSEEYIPGLTSLCDNCIFSGKIVNINGIKVFNMIDYIGTYKQSSELLTKTNIIKEENGNQVHATK